MNESTQNIKTIETADSRALHRYEDILYSEENAGTAVVITGEDIKAAQNSAKVYYSPKDTENSQEAANNIQQNYLVSALGEKPPVQDNVLIRVEIKDAQKKNYILYKTHMPDKIEDVEKIKKTAEFFKLILKTANANNESLDIDLGKLGEEAKHVSEFFNSIQFSDYPQIPKINIKYALQKNSGFSFMNEVYINQPKLYLNNENKEQENFYENNAKYGVVNIDHAKKGLSASELLQYNFASNPAFNPNLLDTQNYEDVTKINNAPAPNDNSVPYITSVKEIEKKPSEDFYGNNLLEVEVEYQDSGLEQNGYESDTNNILEELSDDDDLPEFATDNSIQAPKELKVAPFEEQKKEQEELKKQENNARANVHLKFLFLKLQEQFSEEAGQYRNNPYRVLNPQRIKLCDLAMNFIKKQMEQVESNKKTAADAIKETVNYLKLLSEKAQENHKKESLIIIRETNSSFKTIADDLVNQFSENIDPLAYEQNRHIRNSLLPSEVYYAVCGRIALLENSKLIKTIFDKTDSNPNKESARIYEINGQQHIIYYPGRDSAKPQSTDHPEESLATIVQKSKTRSLANNATLIKHFIITGYGNKIKNSKHFTVLTQKNNEFTLVNSQPAIYFTNPDIDYLEENITPEVSINVFNTWQQYNDTDCGHYAIEAIVKSIVSPNAGQEIFKEIVVDQKSIALNSKCAIDQFPLQNKNAAQEEKKQEKVSDKSNDKGDSFEEFLKGAEVVTDSATTILTSRIRTPQEIIDQSMSAMNSTPIYKSLVAECQSAPDNSKDKNGIQDKLKRQWQRLWKKNTGWFSKYSYESTMLEREFQNGLIQDIHKLIYKPGYEKNNNKIYLKFNEKDVQEIYGKLKEWRNQLSNKLIFPRYDKVYDSLKKLNYSLEKHMFLNISEKKPALENAEDENKNNIRILMENLKSYLENNPDKVKKHEGLKEMRDNVLKNINTDMLKTIPLSLVLDLFQQCQYIGYEHSRLLRQNGLGLFKSLKRDPDVSDIYKTLNAPLINLTESREVKKFDNELFDDDADIVKDKDKVLANTIINAFTKLNDCLKPVQSPVLQDAHTLNKK